MAYYRPLQRVHTDNKWYYTITDGSGVYTHPCCSELLTCKKCDLGSNCEFCNETGFIENPNRCNGHDTSQEATEHYRQYKVLIAQECFDYDTQKKCVICGTFTQNFYAYGDIGWMMNQFYFCDEHFDRKFLNEYTNPIHKDNSDIQE